MLSDNSQEILRTLSDNRGLVENLRSQTERLSHLHQQTISTVAMARREILTLVDRKQKTMVRKRAAIEAKILEGLRFELMSERHEVIAQAHKETFEWIYHDIESSSGPWTNFSSWLQCHGDIYWITGKAGSGKSTLMKYIYSNPQTKRLLLEWSGKERLVTAGFFFWNSGSELQKSLNGMLRSMFYEILEQCHELIRLAFPDQFENLDSLFELTDFRAAMDRWTQQDLVEALNRILTQNLFPAKYFFLVDGLDEFSGEHKEIATTLKSWTQLKSVKLCLSSRPLIAFENVFEECPSLMLQDLTYNDIVLYVRTKLEQDSKFLQLQCEQPLLAPVLVTEIVEKASGVFLWVYLVVASLLSGLQNGDGIQDLQARLRLLPTKLEDLYRHMFQRLEPVYLPQTAKLFETVFCSPEPLTPVELSFLDESDEFVLRRDLELLDHAVIKVRYKRMNSWLKSRSMGLLEIQSARGHPFTWNESGAVQLPRPRTSGLAGRLLGARVEFLHKSVRDFLASPDICSILNKDRDPCWSPQMCLFRLGLIKLKIWPEIHEGWDKVVHKCLHWARILDTSGPPVSSGLKNELDYVVCANIMLNRPHPLPDFDQFKSVELKSIAENQPSSFSCHVMVRQYVDPSFVSTYTGWPLLLLACGIYSLTDSKPNGHPTFLEFLLLHGANPNERFGKGTVWAHILSVFIARPNSVNNESHLMQMELLIRYGADPEACCLPWSFGWTNGRTVLDVIMFSPKEMREKLQTLLRQKIDEKHTRQATHQEMQGTISTPGVGRKKRKRNRKSQEKKGKRQRTNGLR
jgi:hypothetical protein